MKFLPILCLFLLLITSQAQINAFFDEADFDNDVADNCVGCVIEQEGFESFAPGEVITGLTYQETNVSLSPNLEAFYGSWGLFAGCFNTFSGSSLLSTPVYNSVPAVLTLK